MNFLQELETFCSKQKQLLALIGQSIELFKELENTSCIEELEQYHYRINSNFFEIAVVGTFKNGKSTLINALLGEEILPAYALPCTAIINEIKYGEHKEAFIYVKENLTEEQKAMLPQFVVDALSACKNERRIKVPEEQIRAVLTIPRGVSYETYQTPYEKLELYYPNELLKNRVIITDTPGLNEMQERTEITTAHLLHADAIIMVFAADKLCSQDEMNFVKYNLRTNGFHSPFFVINRMDNICAEEQEDIRQEAYQRLSPYTLRGEDGLFFLSAKSALLKSEMSKQMDFKKFVETLSAYLTEENAREKILPSARRTQFLLKQAISEDIPFYIENSKASIQDLLIKRNNEKKTLSKLKDKIEIIIQKMYNKKQTISNDIQDEAHKFLDAVVRNIELWINEFQPKKLKGLNVEKKAKDVQEELNSYIIDRLKENTAEWYQETYQPLALRKMEETRQEISLDIIEFADILAKTKQATWGEEGIGDFEIDGFEDQINGREGFLKAFGFRFFASVGMGAALTFTGLIAPIFILIAGVVGLVIGVNKCNEQIVDTVKTEFEKKYIPACRTKLEEILNNLCNNTEEVFENYIKHIEQELNNKLRDEEERIEKVIRRIESNKYDKTAETERLEELMKRTDAILVAFDEFIQGVV